MEKKSLLEYQGYRAAVENYVEHCAERGEAPEREFSGRFNLRLSPEQHRALAIEAKRKGQSLNDVVVKRLFG